MTVRSEFFTGHGGARLALHRLGEGRPLVLVHGLFSSAQMNWIKWGHAALLAEAGFEVLMPDLRAHGQSAAPHEAEAYPADVLALDLMALIAALGLEDFDLGGFSLGARTSVRGVLHGLRPRRLVLGGMGLEGLAGWSGRQAFFLDVLDRFDAIRMGDPAYMTVQFMKSMKVDRVAARLLLQTMTDTAPDTLAALTMPVLVVCGDPQALVRALPSATHAVIPGTHMGCVTQPELGRAIRDFLAD